MTDERLTVFIDSLYGRNTPFLEELERKALSEGIPIIKKETQAFLRFLLSYGNVRNVLEIGTATGFSALFMAELLGEGSLITTIESYDKRYKEAKVNIEASGFPERVRLLTGDAGKILPELKGPYDLIFIDAAKAQYPVYLKEALRLLDEKGFIVADNCLRGGEILESRFAVERRNRTIHKRMREFLKELTTSEELVCVVLPVGDGVAAAYRRKKNEET